MATNEEKAEAIVEKLFTIVHDEFYSSSAAQLDLSKVADSALESEGMNTRRDGYLANGNKRSTTKGFTALVKLVQEVLDSECTRCGRITQLDLRGLCPTCSTYISEKQV